MNDHRFRVGQAVEYYPPRSLCAPRGIDHVTAELKLGKTASWGPVRPLRAWHKAQRWSGTLLPWIACKKTRNPCERSASIATGHQIRACTELRLRWRQP